MALYGRERTRSGDQTEAVWLQFSLEQALACLNQISSGVHPLTCIGSRYLWDRIKNYRWMICLCRFKYVDDLLKYFILVVDDMKVYYFSEFRMSAALIPEAQKGATEEQTSVQKMLIENGRLIGTFISTIQ